jgi:hypothetical protein
MIRDMTAVLYPVAPNAELALSRPLGRAAREREATKAAGEAVAFTTDAVGPAFATREAALAAYAGRVEDERTGAAPDPADRFCRLAEQIVGQPGQDAPRAVEPTFEDGRRWPQPSPDAPRTAWRLMVSYWRIATAERPIEAPQARQARRSRRVLDPATLRAMARQPLRPVEPQQPLDIGLFEVRLPESPHIVVPDE